MRRLWLFAAMLALTLLAATAAQAVEIRTGSSREVGARGLRVGVAAGETVEDDLLLAGETVTIDGTVNGDTVAAGESIIVNGTINGNLIMAGGKLHLKGTVNGTVIALGQSIMVEGTVARNLASAGGSTIIYPTASVGSSWVGAGDRLDLRGSVGRGAALAGSDVDVQGRIGRELRAAVERLYLERTAEIGGPVTYWSAREAEISPEARTGPVIRNEPVRRSPRVPTGPWFHHPIWILLKLGGFLLVGLALLSLLPDVRERFPRILTGNPWQAPLAGFLALLAVPVAALILLITVVGLPLGVVTLALFPVCIYMSQVFVAYSVARLLSERVEWLHLQAWPILFLLGALITTVLVETPFFGPLFGAAFLFYGVGGLYFLLTSKERAAS